MKAFEIFKTGKHTSSNGITKEYSLDDLNNIADMYNSSEHEAPIVIGHPESNAPAFGWIEKLFVKGDRLFAQAKDLVDAFVTAVKENQFKKRSISLTSDGLLNHVGFLGAAVPAVKGLADVEFSDKDDITSFESSIKDLASSIEPAQRNSSSDVDGHQESSNQQPDSQLKNYFTELNNKLTGFINEFNTVMSKHSETNQSFMEENKEELGRLENKMSDLRARIDISNFELMLTEKVAYGSLTPAMKDKLVNILTYFDKLNFEETNSVQLSSDIQNLLTEFVNSVPKIMSFEEVAEDEEGDEKVVDDSFDEFDLDPDSQALHESILSAMKRNEISYEEAFHKVVNEK